MRGGKLYDAQWGSRMRGEGIFAEQIAQMFDVARRKAGFKDERANFPRRRFGVRGARNFHCFKGIHLEFSFAIQVGASSV